MAVARPRAKPPLQRLLSAFREQLEDVWPEQAPLDDGTADQLGRLAARDVVGKYLWLSAAGELCDSTAVAARLGVRSRQAVQARSRRGTLLGVEQGGRTAFPAWQFDPSGQPYPAVARVIHAFRAEGIFDPWVVISWFSTLQDELEGSTPLEWMRQGRPDLALEHAAAHTAFRLTA